jgi:hypothetical protein
MATTLVIQQQLYREPRKVDADTAEGGTRSRFDPATPTVFQTGSWQCSAASTAWVLQSLGYSHSQDDVVALLGPSQIDADVGLHFGDGRGLVALLQGLGLTARNAFVSFDEMLAMAGTRPVAMGGAAFYHWVAVRGRDAETLALANPGPGWRGIHQTLNRSEFAALGPFAAVWVEDQVLDEASDLAFDPSSANIAACIGCDAETVDRYWPALRAALIEHGITEPAGIIAAIATVRVEAPTFEPIHEYGGPEYWAQYEGRHDLGNVERGDGVRYHGRGFIQLTGRANYRRYGQLLDVPLEDEPDLALEPAIASRVFARYFSERGVHQSAAAGDWRAARVKVNGGTNGLDHFLALVQALQRLR